MHGLHRLGNPRGVRWAYRWQVGADRPLFCPQPCLSLPSKKEFYATSSGTSALGVKLPNAESTNSLIHAPSLMVVNLKTTR